MIATDWPSQHRLLDGHLEAGLTKFVVCHRGGSSREAFLERFVEELLPRQN
ncbi:MULTISPECIES: hypothetical protein [unclassified Amycolatopsis]|uniref:hypothetical protein n=1 Tax=unclassified Amycolatopsis TaxID=2618356 RepID=UPI0002628965|nr:hypothetical protein [Amycolatopsis sp. ATCC 39116]